MPIDNQKLIDALTLIGPDASLPEVTATLARLYPRLPQEYTDFLHAVSAHLQRYSSDASNFTGTHNLFSRRDARWSLRASEFELEHDLQALRSRRDVNETLREALILARRGQGTFREQVLRSWQDRCAVTGCTVTEAIRASHIKPWRDSSDDERLDPNNGLPLIANLDALFDRFLITFDPAGQILVSPAIPDQQAGLLVGTFKCLRQPWPEMLRYLEVHMCEFETGRICPIHH